MFILVVNYLLATFTILSLAYKRFLALFISYLINLERGVFTLSAF